MNTLVKAMLVKLVPGLFAYCISHTVTAQEWERVPGLPQTEFTVLEVIDETPYAAAANHLYISSGSGFNWLHRSRATMRTFGFPALQI
jgi:hypothetical protein